MRGIHRTRALAVGLAIVGVLTTASLALADYESEKNNDYMGFIERGLDKFTPDTAIFDGEKITAGASVSAVNGHFDKCNNAIKTWNKYEKQVSAKGKATDRFKKIVTRMQKLVPYCKKLHTAAQPYIADINAKAAAASKAKDDAKATCLAVYGAALDAVGINDLYEILDTWRGSMTPATAEHITEFRGKLEKLVPACAQAKFKGVVQACKGHGIMLSSATNQRFDYGDICAPALDPKQTLADVAMRLLMLSVRHSTRDLPTADSFRKADGWIHDVNAIYYKSYFEVTDETKKAAAKQIKEAFDAAGVDPPKDMSVVWAERQKFLDALKAAVDATAAEWSVDQSKCKGYACSLAKKSLKKYYKGATVKAVYGRDWRIAKNALDIPTHKYMGLWVVFKVKGEDYCQVRSMTATENYKGGGKYQKAKGTAWGYARFQKKC